jgi:hypothetical protein
MGRFVVSNFGTSTLASTITDSDTTLSVQSGDASKFPSPSGGDSFPLVVTAADGTREIMLCTARASAVLTVTRGQEGTSAAAFDAGARVDMRATKAIYDSFVQTGDIDTDTTLAANSDSKVPSQKAIKSYVDGLALNLGKRQRVRAATTANITISTALNNGDTLDGVSLATGDLVLVKNQSTASQNGVYVVGVSPARFAEFDAWADFPGSQFSVAEGSTNADTLWLCTSNDGGTLDSSSLAFSKLIIAGELLASNNLSDVGSAATAFANIKQAATTSATGVVELATDAEAIAMSDTARAVTPSNLDASVEKLGRSRANVEYTADQIAVATDAGKLVKLNKATAINYTIPPESDVAWPADTYINLAQTGAGQAAVVAGTGVTIRKEVGLKLNAQYAMATITKIGTNEWLLGGSLKA